jgi:Mce-associated membrane protein
MTKPNSGAANEKSDQPQGESAAVRVRTDSASGQDAKAAEPVEGEANEATDTESTAGAQDTGVAEAVNSHDAETGDKADEAEPAKPKPRTRSPRARTSSVNGRRGGKGTPPPVRAVTTPHSNHADQSDEKSVETEAKDPSDAADTACAEDSGEVEAVNSHNAETGDKADEAEPAKPKRRTRSPRARTSSVNGPRGGKGTPPPVRGATTPHSNDADDRADQSDEKSVEAEAEDPSDAAASADARDSGEVEAAISDDAEAPEKADEAERTKITRRISWPRVLVYGLLPGLALSLALAAGYLKWQDTSARASQIARIDAVAAAKDSTIALLSYQSDTVEKDLDAAKGRLTGAFKESYSQLIKDVVIPGSKRDHISTKATVPAASLVSATPDHAVTLLFVNQTAVVDKDQPADTDSSVRVTLDKIAGRWLISGFDPV